MTGSFPLYGTALAESVAAELVKGNAMLYSHRDYCGIGLVWESEKNIIWMSKVVDGYPMEVGSDDLQGGGPWTKEEFVPWLAQQSDQTLLGDGNQRINRARMLQWLHELSPEGIAEKAAARASAVARDQAAKKADMETKAAEKARRQAANEERAQQELSAALATDEAALANMSKKDVIELIRKVASPESDLLKANMRVLMSPASTKEQLDALWRQVKEQTVLTGA